MSAWQRRQVSQRCQPETRVNRIASGACGGTSGDVKPQPRVLRQSRLSARTCSRPAAGTFIMASMWDGDGWCTTAAYRAPCAEARSRRCHWRNLLGDAPSGSGPSTPAPPARRKWCGERGCGSVKIGTESSRTTASISVNGASAATIAAIRWRRSLAGGQRGSRDWLRW